ncbi:MAG: PhzF family phenazine biosynthesis protein [Muribaculaceae bacterium]|nr:PhzF family phenazine biosynthesis protein [Muribaculaceae bacterium]
MKYYIVDAFTSEPFGGNPAGVVLLKRGCDFPSDRLMTQIAAEFRYSETAFVRHDAAREFTVRYFTPCSEVDLCGHATIATFGTLRRTGIVPQGSVCLNHTLAGDLEVRVDQQVMMQMATPRVIPATIDIAQLHRIMAGDAAVFTTRLPVEIVSTGLPDIMMPIDSVEALNQMRPDMDALAALSDLHGVTGVHAFAFGDDGYTAHVRNFGPLYGVPEESATGTANAALTHYLLRHGIIDAEAHNRFLQGEAMQRPSVVATSVIDGIIYVGGDSRIIAHGTLTL